MIWWIDLSFNILLFAFFGFLAYRILIVRKAILLGSTLYCSALMLGLLLLSLHDLTLLHESGWSFRPEYWRGWLFYVGSLFYLFLIPRMIKEFFVFHLSERDYRDLSLTFFKALNTDYTFDPEGYVFKTNQKDKIFIYYHFFMKFGVWCSDKLKPTFIDARYAVYRHIKMLQPLKVFSWQGLFFLIIALLLLIRIFSLTYIWMV